MSDLDKPVALVTGAAFGIGKATAQAFVNAGYRTVLADLDDAAGKAAAAALRGEGHEVVFVRCDVSSDADVRAMVEQAVAIYGRIDAVFNNAGIEGRPGNVVDCSEENFDRVIAVNLKSVWLCMRHQIAQMLHQGGGGAIVNCASVAGLIGLPDMPAYVASKHGVIGLTRAAAVEWAAKGIRVNAVCPGAIETPMLDRHAGGDAEARDSLGASAPMERIGQPEEIASAVLWLCSEGARFATGQAIAVDGGWTVR